MAELKPKQKRFVEEFLVDRNATQAAIRAGYSPKTARFIAAENLTKPHIAAEIEARERILSQKTAISAEYVLTCLQSVAERCMQAEEVKDREGNGTGEYRFDSGGANKALELIGKHLGMFKDKVEHSGEAGGPIIFQWQGDKDG